MSDRVSASFYRKQFIPSSFDLDEVDAFVCPPHDSLMPSVPESTYIHNPPSTPAGVSLLDLDTVSNVTESRCRDYHWLAHWDSSFECRPAAPAERCCSQPSGGWVAFNGEFIKAGLSFPLPPLLLEILDWYGPCLMQWTPSAIRLILAFLAKCYLMEVCPSVNLFRCFFKPERVREQWGLFSFRSHVCSTAMTTGMQEDPPFWRNRFFFVRRVSDALVVPCVWRDLRGGAFSRPSPDIFKDEIRRLSCPASHDIAILCSPEILSYCGLISRRLAPGKVSLAFSVICLAVS